MSFVRNLSMKGKLTLLTSVFALGFIIFGVVSYNTLDTVKVNGVHYGRIIQNKDLIADVLPPPNYIVETYLTARQLAGSKTPQERKELIVQYNNLKKEYATRQEYWKENMAASEVKTELNERSRKPAEAFFAAIDFQLLPALEKGDQAAAQAVIDNVLPPLYAEHRASVNKIVEQTNANAAATETDVQGIITQRTWILIAVGATLFVLVGALAWWLRIAVAKQEERDCDFTAKMIAINKTQAVIEFQLDGTIVAANEIFCKTMGYTLDEIKGRHHSIFVTEKERNSPEYQEFWAKLKRGEDQTGEFFRLGKGGKRMAIQASYNPIPGTSGRLIKVVKYAADITGQVEMRNDVNKYRVIVEESVASIMTIDRNFTVTYANASTMNLLNKHLEALRMVFPGFDPKKLVGSSIDQFHKNPSHQRQLLSDPSRLPYETDIHVGPLTFALRVTAVRDLDGNYTGNSLEWKDVTAERKQAAVDADYRGQLAAISKSQAVIEFTLDGTVVTANENFLQTLGYSMEEIKGRHHSLFVDEQHKYSHDYKELWSKLNRGEYVTGEFKRIGKGNKEVWIQASYNPIMDLNGKPVKVMKYATEITAQVKAREEMARILDQVNGSANMLASSAEELTSVSAQMASNAEETSAQANVVSAASEQVSKNVQTVATGVEEMNSAIREIAKNASDAARVSQQAVTTASTANATISKLGDSSAEIGKVIKVITSIAEQTNLLALNATIEAARAGEAGKGFAVVANEVKELAKETAKATEDISRKIEAIQGDTDGAVDSIRKIGEVIAQINDISNTIASAVEEQTATANEMSRNVAEAAKGTSEIAQNITSVAQAAQDTTQGANNCQQAASELSRMAADLQQLGGGSGNNPQSEPQSSVTTVRTAQARPAKNGAKNTRHESFVPASRA